jgi:succinyl-CoA synthetase beta subunit/citryl-CoA synthetase large subunit
MAKLLEHHAKQFLSDNGVKIPSGSVAGSPLEAAEAASNHGGACMIKALVPLGKKGKAGFIQPASNPKEAESIAKKILGQEMSGYKISQVLVEACIDIEEELFVSFTYDSHTRAPLLLFSPKGGVDIEELAEKHPEFLFRVPINIIEGLSPYMARALCFEAGLSKQQTSTVSKVLVSLYAVFYGLDARLLEVNPLAITRAGDVYAVGCLCNIDEEALFRHPELGGLITYGQDRSIGEVTDRERKVVEADQAAAGSGSVRYTEFDDGEIAFGIIGGGASLTAMDAIFRMGLKPANYCDLGPGKGSQKKIEALFDAILSKPGIKAFVTGANIAGAADISFVPAMIKSALDRNNIDPLKMPVVARWAGMNDEKVRSAFEAMPGVHFFGSEISIEKAAEKIVELVQASEQGGVS